MSGGSFEYLCYKDFPEICDRGHLIKEMADRLAELGYLDAAKETEKLLLDLTAIEVRITAKLERLQPVWKAVEWYDSSDWGEESVKEEVEKYRNG